MELKVKLKRKKNIVYSRILMQDSSIRSQGENMLIISDGFIRIFSVGRHEITDNALFIHGRNEDVEYSSYKFQNINSAKEFVKRIKKLVKKINNGEGERVYTKYTKNLKLLEKKIKLLIKAADLFCEQLEPPARKYWEIIVEEFRKLEEK